MITRYDRFLSQLPLATMVGEMNSTLFRSLMWAVNSGFGLLTQLVAGLWLATGSIGKRVGGHSSAALLAE